MQACYAAGVDLWPSNPYRHRFAKYEYESTRIAKMKNLKTVPYSKAKRGDLIFYSKHGTVMHIAIYLGKGKIIHSWPGRVQISRANTGRFGHLSKVKRVFVTK
jgi:cell wall-associated NlpC family hydrolase